MDPTVLFAALSRGAATTVRGKSPVKLEGYVDEILAGGFPGMRGRPWRALVAQLNGYLERIVDHDLPEAGWAAARARRSRRSRRPARKLAASSPVLIRSRGEDR